MYPYLYILFAKKGGRRIEMQYNDYYSLHLHSCSIILQHPYPLYLLIIANSVRTEVCNIIRKVMCV